MKYLHQLSLNSIQKTFIYSKKAVYLEKDTDRRSNTSDKASKQTDLNLTDRIIELKDYIFKKNQYYIPLGFLVDLGRINFAQKTDTKFILTLGRKMNKLFESNKKVTAFPDEPDALIQFDNRPYISYHEINLTQNFDIYFSRVLRAETALRMGVINSTILTQKFLKLIKVYYQ